jgi:peptidoglycan/LPS O-acetylase OafA/YrhL
MNAIKTIVMFLITNGHVLWFILSLPMKNPLFVEQNYHNLISMIMINGENLPNTFFFFSGFLLCILSYPLLQEECDKSKKFFIKAVIYRYLRLMPLMTFFLMVDSSWMYRLGSGPFWDRLNFSERQFCRKNWWTNLLFMNNYISGDEKCLVHSWFISTDFHLSMIGLIILIIIAKRPSRKRIVLISSLIISFCIVTAHVFVFNLQPVFLIIPE